MSPLFITVDVRSVYGKETIYPVDAAARTFASIAGTTTLTKDTLRGVFALGYEIRRAPHPSSLVMEAGHRASLAALIEPQSEESHG